MQTKVQHEFIDRVFQSNLKSGMQLRYFEKSYLKNIFLQIVNEQVNTALLWLKRDHCELGLL